MSGLRVILPALGGDGHVGAAGVGVGEHLGA